MEGRTRICGRKDIMPPISNQARPGNTENQLASIVTTQGQWTKRPSGQTSHFTSNAALLPRNTYTQSASLFTGTSGSVEVISGLPLYQMACFKFLCKKNTSGTEWVGRSRLSGISEVSDSENFEYLADYLCTLTLTFGDETPTAPSVILPYESTSNPYRYCKSIDIDEDRALFPGIRVVGQEPGEDSPVPTLVLDGMGYLGYILQMTILPPSGFTGPLETDALYRTI